MKTNAWTGAVRVKPIPALVLSTCAALMAACSPPPVETDGGADVAAAETAADSTTDSARSDSAADSAPVVDAGVDANGASDANGANDANDATSESDASNADGAMDASDAAMDSAMGSTDASDAAMDSARDSAPDSAPDVVCPAGQRSCAGRCVDVQTDLMNCGACGTVCAAPPTGMAACLAGRCGAVPGSQMTQNAGSATPITLGQPSLAVSMVVATTGVFPARDSFGAGSAVGMIHLFAGDFTPGGAPFARGQVISIASNTALFSLLGTTYGGDGRTTFALPNMQERFLVGPGTGGGLPPASLGVVFGNSSATLSIATMPNHSHLLVDGTTRTSAVGGGAAWDHRAPSVPITAWMATEGVYPSMSSGASMPFIGQIRWFAGNFTPTGGWVPADGRLLSIAENSVLFSVIGTTFGGDGVSTFAAPDLRGRVPIGPGAAAGGPTITLGQQVGASSTTLTVAQMASHQHALVGGGNTQPAGNSQAFSAYQPSLGITWMIATQGIFPARDGSGSFDPMIPYLGELIAFAGNFAPRGFLQANGQLLQISTNAALFSLLGTMYGGDGRTNFALPDLRGRSPVGTSPTAVTGSARGTATHAISPANLPAHAHTF